MSIINKDSLEAILRPLKNKLDNCMPKTGGKFSSPISITNGNNDSTISVEKSYTRITSGDTKMDITTEEKYTQNKDIPYEFSRSSAVAIGNNIYLLGSGNNNYRNYNYKYGLTTTNCIIKPSNSYIRITSGVARMDITNNGDILINGGNILDNTKIKLKTSNNYIIKQSDHSIYTSDNKAYTDDKAQIITLTSGVYYTEYNGNNIIKNNYPINNGIGKMYIKQGAMINGKPVTVSREGWNEITIINYI